MGDFRHSRYDYGDVYEGHKDALIKAGVAKLEWFPAGPQFDKFGRTRRTFHIESADRDITLQQRSAGDWWMVRSNFTTEAQMVERRAQLDAEDWAVRHLQIVRELSEAGRMAVLMNAMTLWKNEQKNLAGSNRGGGLRLVYDAEAPA